MSKDILNKLPPNFDLEVAQKRYPVMYTECKNTVVCQELQRFNKLLTKVRSSLQDLQKAVKGLVVMDASTRGPLEGDAQQPAARPVGEGLVPVAQAARVVHRRAARAARLLPVWVDDGPPTIFQMPHFFFVQAFMTGVLQNYARKYTIPIDTIDFDFEYYKETPDGAARGRRVHPRPLPRGRADGRRRGRAQARSSRSPRCSSRRWSIVLLKPAPQDQTSPSSSTTSARATARPRARGVLATTGPPHRRREGALDRPRRRAALQLIGLDA